MSVHNQAQSVWGNVWQQNRKTAEAESRAGEWEARLREAQARDTIGGINSNGRGSDRDPIEDARRAAEMRKSENDTDALRNYSFRDMEEERGLDRWNRRQTTLELAANRQYETQRSAATEAMRNRDRMGM